ncbi:MAG: UbiD family decarboxylase [Thermoproteota archaeon]|jgi:2,5-furandicarboxylate decarboxylase 1|nr:UbiD family decarboxylase [Thermoproteota archaeon]
MEITRERSPNDSSNHYINYDFRGFLMYLEQIGELTTVKKDVSPRFELAGVGSKFEGKEAVLFEKVNGSNFRVACNVLGTRKRFCLAIAVKDEKEIHARITSSISKFSSSNEVSRRALFQENYSHNLMDLPIITHFEKDAGAYITSSVVFARNSENESQNSSTHRLLRLDEKHMVIRMVEGRHLHRCFSLAKEHGEDLRVSIAIGLHPAISISAAYQAAYGINEMEIANSLLNGKLTMAKSDYTQLLIPAHAEIVLEGKILKDRTHEEWMVEMLRTYDFRRKQPVFELDKIWFRNNAVYHDILPGFSEHRLLMGLPVEAKMFEAVRNVVPKTHSVYLTEGGSNWLDAVIQISKSLEGEPKNAIIAAFASHPSLKMAVVVDDDIDPTNPAAVEYAISTRCQADKGLVVITNAKGSTLDPSSDQDNLVTTKVGIDATATLLKPKERFEIAQILGSNEIDISKYLDKA